MSYLRFDKTLMTNLEESLPKEILRTNRSGAYHCTTIVDCNTRKYHGLLVIPVPEIDDENHVLLSSLDETVVQHGAEFNLGLHKYQGNNYSPRGHKYIREFECEKVPTTWYRVGGVVLKKEKLFVHHENRILIRYTLVEAHSATTLRLRPFLAFRSVRQYTHENAQASRDYQEVDNGIKTCMYAGYPELFMQLNKKNEFHFQPDWYRGIEYPKEQERGYDFNEDLYVPGYFEVDIKKGESVVFSGGVSEASTRTLKKTFEEEMEERTPRDNFQHCLINAAHQFLNKQNEESYILAGYPWFKCRARDMFIALPGLTLAIDEVAKFESVMETARKAIHDFINDEPNDLKIYEMEHPDVLLWAVWCIQQYAKMVSRDKCREKYGQLLEEIMEYLRRENHPNLFLHSNGLLYANGTEKAITWMNSTVNGHPVIPRTGYIVEINALWYNALCFVGELVGETGNNNLAETLQTLAEQTGKSFIDTFLNEYGYLLDYVDGNMMDWSVRPNMIFTVAFDYSPLDARQKKGVLDVVTKELLTPKGLRSLSPKSGETGNNNLAETLQTLAEQTGKSFIDTFLNEYGYLLDYVDGNMMDWSVRPNMIFTVAFDYSPLDARQKKGVLDVVTKELLTPKGLRSLSPKSGGYNPNYVGPQMQRDYAYHQGTAWPWLAGFYFEAYLRIYKMSALGFIERQLIGYEDEMVSHCIGSIPELFDGNPPFKGRGAVSFAMNVAEILRVLYLLSKYNY